MRRLLLAAAMALALSGCADLVETDPSTAAPTSTTSTTAAPAASSTAPPAGDAETAPPCAADPEDLVMEGSAEAFGSGAGDAAAVGAVRWQSHDECERVLVDLLTEDGAPASRVGEGVLEMLAGGRIARLRLPDGITVSAVADTRVEGTLVDRIYVVRDAESLFVDVHLATAGGVRAIAAEPPARAIVDVVAVDEASQGVAAAVSSTVVVVTPTAGPVAAAIPVDGYLRPGEDRVTAEIRVDGRIATSQEVEVAAATNTWSRFQLVLDSADGDELELVVGVVATEGTDPLGVSILLQPAG